MHIPWLLFCLLYNIITLLPKKKKKKEKERKKESQKKARYHSAQIGQPVTKSIFRY
jgi:hypothetical protein